MKGARFQVEMIKTVDLHKSFGQLQVLRGVNQTIQKGEAVSIIGPSGGGKSTFLRCLNLLEKPDSGQIFLEGKEITGKHTDIDTHRQKMGMVFQHFNVFPHLTVAENITMGDLKGALTTIMRKIYGEDAVMRFRPHHFPFTEPSCEMDMQCHKCHGTGEIDGQVCSTCHGEGWIELLGAGMVHPKVLENCGIDPEKYSGFAFGMGLERMAMGRMKINDLRLIFDNDIRFLNQF